MLLIDISSSYFDRWSARPLSRNGTAASVPVRLSSVHQRYGFMLRYQEIWETKALLIQAKGVIVLLAVPYHDPLRSSHD